MREIERRRTNVPFKPQRKPEKLLEVKKKNYYYVLGKKEGEGYINQSNGRRLVTHKKTHTHK